MNKRIILFSFCFMFFTLFFYTEHSRAAEQGKCGSDAFYSFDEETGVMTISGTGVISREWDDILQEKIEQLVIEEGITTLPYEFFLDCTTLKKVQLAGWSRSREKKLSISRTILIDGFMKCRI